VQGEAKEKRKNKLKENLQQTTQKLTEPKCCERDLETMHMKKKKLVDNGAPLDRKRGTKSKKKGWQGKSGGEA